jgi:AraC family transcriptional regulator
MEKGVEKAVARVIEVMRGSLGEQFTIDDMARVAAFSKFHFSRVFQRTTGVSPGRFLSAMRLQEAKRLLVTTSLSVTDISHQVGYSSVGTFSSRFHSSVGVSPTTYRRLGGFAPRICLDNRHRVAGSRPATVRGRVLPPPADEVGLVFIGLFPDRMPEGQPVKCTVLAQPGPYVLEDVPQGAWYLLIYSVGADREENASPIPRPRSGDDTSRRPSHHGLFVGAAGPIMIRPDTMLRPANVHLRPMCALDPPVLLALLDGRENFLPGNGSGFTGRSKG